MWALINQTPYAAERNWIRDKNGVHHWLVAVKATFDIARHGKLTLADEQLAPVLEPEYRGDPAHTSLRVDSDLLAAKPATDVLLDAVAYAPKGKPAGTVPVSLRVGDLEKTLLVHGTRAYYKGALGLTTSAPQPYTSRPIHYEWAFGGTDTTHADPGKHRIDMRNPVGKGIATDLSRLENKEAHAIEYPNAKPDKAGPAGFGPLASFWSPRLERGGTYDAHWKRAKKPLLPDDYDERFALAAPDDQRPAKPLRGGETVTLVNMTREGALRFELPKIFLTFTTTVSGQLEEHRAILVSVLVAAELMKVSLVWQSTLTVSPRDVDYLDFTLIAEKPFLL